MQYTFQSKVKSHLFQFVINTNDYNLISFLLIRIYATAQSKPDIIFLLVIALYEFC